MKKDKKNGVYRISVYSCPACFVFWIYETFSLKGTIQMRYLFRTDHLVKAITPCKKWVLLSGEKSSLQRRHRAWISVTPVERSAPTQITKPALPPRHFETRSTDCSDWRKTVSSLETSSKSHSETSFELCKGLCEDTRWKIRHTTTTSTFCEYNRGQRRRLLSELV